MRDALGGVVNIAIIVVFITLVSGFMAYNINYTKAFRVKNKIITTLEQYEGRCEQNSSCDQEIVAYMRSLGYSSPSLNVAGYECRSGYCIKTVSSNYGSGPIDRNKVYFQVVTAVNIDIPIINKILPNIRLFRVTGNTKLIDAS